MLAFALAVLAFQELVEVEGQPLAANAERVLQALEILGHPAAVDLKSAGRDARKIQQALDPFVVLEYEVGGAAKARRPALLQQAGYTPVLIKILNPSGSTKELGITSPQSGPVYAGVAELSMKRQDQKYLRENENVKGDPDRFLQVEMVQAPPMTPRLSGLKVEYVLALVYSGVSGKRAAEIALDGASAKVELAIRPAIPVRLSIRDADGTPTTGRLVFVDAGGRVHPSQPKRLAPDLFFQKQIYRHDGESVLLPPGPLRMRSSRGPEYHEVEQEVKVPSTGEGGIDVKLRRWVHPLEHGYYSGDHHIHAAGCAHYTKPTEGVFAPDMFRQVKGEGLNVGCILTWGPCFDFQKQFLSPSVDKLSEPLTLLKYDIEVSGFGSQALGHVCLLDLKDPVYPGSEGTRNWPSWTTPVMRWAKKQGAVTGYAHSASGLQVVPANAAKRLLDQLDADKDGSLSAGEALSGLLPEPFERTDGDGDKALSLAELTRSCDRAADGLPNLAIPEMNSVGAMEIFVTASQGLCDFISAMDTARLPEWNCWYHLLNCGLPVKVSGETDFPCMSGTRVGQGRVYVRLGKLARLDYGAWCEGLAKGRSYVSDGYAHALEFSVEGKAAGEEVALAAPGRVTLAARVAFSSQTPLEAAYGSVLPPEGRRIVGDTVELHPGAVVRVGTRIVEVVVNGRAIESREVAADDAPHDLRFTVPIDRSSWVALRQFPQMHTNPVNVIVGGRPIRASRGSALWSIGCIEQLWRVRGNSIATAERDEAKRTFDAAIEHYRRVAADSPE